MFSLAMLAFLHSNPPIATSTPSTLLACRYKCKWVLSLAPYAPKSFRSNPLTYLPELVFTILWCRCSGRKTRSRSPHPRVPSRANLGFEAPLVFESPHTTSPQPLNQRPLSLSLSLSLSVCPLRSCLGSRWSVKTKEVVGGVQDATFPCIISVFGQLGVNFSQSANRPFFLFVCFFLHTTFCTRTVPTVPSFP